MKNRCINVVIDKITKKKRKCKNKAGYLFCSIHNKWKMGICFFVLTNAIHHHNHAENVLELYHGMD